MPEHVMRGNRTIRPLIKSFLEVQIPAVLPYFREQWGLDEKTLPNPLDYDTNDPHDTKEYPAMGSYITGTTEFRKTDDLDSGASEYLYTAEVTLFVAACTAYMGVDPVSGSDIWESPERDSAMRQRDDLMAIMRESVFRFPSLGTAGADTTLFALQETWRESYPEPIKVSDFRNPWWLCSGIVNVTVKVCESTHELPWVDIDSLVIGVEKLSF